MSTGSPLPRVDEPCWYEVRETSCIGAARRAATLLAQRVDFSECRTTEAGIIATELCTNLIKHAGGGRLLLRSLDDHGIEMLAVDSGPGIVDPVLAETDGYTTAGSLGIGLGAIRRLSDAYDLYSTPGKGTALAVRMWSGPRPQRWAGFRGAGLSRPAISGFVCGDDYALREEGGRLVVLLSDGLGHGPEARSASQVAVRTFLDQPYQGLTGTLELIHQACGRTRGVAVSMAELDPVRGLVRFAGIGNVNGWVVRHGERRGLTVLPGIAGHRIHGVREQEVPAPADSWVVLHSDGLTDRWNLDAYPGLLVRDPLLIAGVLLRDAGVYRDDASIVVFGSTGSNCER